VQKMDPQRYAELEQQAQRESAGRVELYKQLANVKFAVSDEALAAS